MKKLTINDIAQALGVSKTTVSRAISGKGRISDETTARIRDYIEQHQYTPNIVARGLANSMTYNIGVVWPGDYQAAELPFFQRCMLGMSRVTGDAGYDIMVSLIGREDISNLRRMVENHKVDGVILTRTLEDDLPAAYLKESGLPFAVIGNTGDPGICSVDNDNYGACRELTRLLIRSGMKRPLLAGGDAGHRISGVREKAFLDTLVREGMGDGLLPEEMAFRDTQADGAEHLLDYARQMGADGIICMDDGIALSVWHQCVKEGIRIPEELKLASFYDSPILATITPAVTAIGFDDMELGACAARLILALIRGGEADSCVLDDYEIRERESTA